MRGQAFPRAAPGPADRQAAVGRQYLIYAAAMNGGDVLIAAEAVSSWALDHPEVDMDESMTWAEWEQESRGS